MTPAERLTVGRDPRDNRFLEVALTGKADVIVSGDQDLLVLNPFDGIPIIPPGRFLQALDAESNGPKENL